MASYFHLVVLLQHCTPLCNSRITQSILLINSNRFAFQMTWKVPSKISADVLHCRDSRSSNWDLQASFNFVSETKRASQFAFPLVIVSAYSHVLCPQLTPAPALLMHRSMNFV
jgi:hypothetical protein